MGIFDWLGNNPSKSSKKYLDQIPDTIKPYYEDYINAGNRQIPGLEEQYGQLINDPGSKLNDFGKNYQKSPGFDFAMKQALQGSGNAMAAGGMAGTPMHEQENMQLATDLANQDYNTYIQHAMNLYGQGLGGSEKLYQGGMNSSDALAKMLAENLKDKASNSATGAQWKNQMNLGLTGLGLTGAFDYYNKPTNGSGGGSGGGTGSSSGGNAGGGMEKYLPMLLAMM